MESMRSDADHKRFAYLRCLLGPPSADDEQPRSGPSEGVPPRLRRLYVALLCKVDPAEVIPFLRHLPVDFLEWDDALRTCEDEGVLDAVVWTLDWRGSPKAALKKVGAFGVQLSAAIGGLVAQGAGVGAGSELQQLKEHLESLEAIGRTGVGICVGRSSKQAEAAREEEEEEDVSVEELWFQLLHAQISTVQAVSTCCAPDTVPNYNANADAESPGPAQYALSRLRLLVQATFSALVSASAARGRGRGISFPRLFTRLVETTTLTSSSSSSSSSGTGTGTPYTEFRAILTGMMEAYRTEGDMLVITKHLLDRDVFQTVERAARARSRGWAPRAGTCAGCRLPLISPKQLDNSGSGAGTATAAVGRVKGKGKGKGVARGTVEVTEDEGDEEEESRIRILRTGIAYHGSCLPS